MNDKMKPALIGGVILGLLSAIPFVNMVNVCCCAWAILGGALATYFYVKNSTTPATMGDGAMLGVLAGVIGGVIYVILGVPLGIAVGNTMANAVGGLLAQTDPNQAAEFQRQMAQSTSVGSAILSGIVGAIILAVFATIGGLIGVPIFEKRKGGAGVPPPPPPPGGGFGQGV